MIIHNIAVIVAFGAGWFACAIVFGLIFGRAMRLQNERHAETLRIVKGIPR